jgi:hypothetical protein
MQAEEENKKVADEEKQECFHTDVFCFLRATNTLFVKACVHHGTPDTGASFE